MIDPERVTEISNTALSTGAHAILKNGMCVMEAVAYVNGEPWSDCPSCACPVISSFMRYWNDSLDDETRQKLRPYIVQLGGTKSTAEVESARAWIATDWLIRTYTPAWLRLAGLNEHADKIASSVEVKSPKNAKRIQPALNAAGDAARAAARAAAWTAAGDAAWTGAAGDAARAAARAAADAAGYAAWTAAWTGAAGDAAWTAARAAAWTGAAGDAAWTAARDAARAAAGDALRPTILQLQESAFELLDRMIA